MRIQLSDHFTVRRLLPLVLGMDGIWAAIVVAEIMAMTMAMTMALVSLIVKRKKFHYWD